MKKIWLFTYLFVTLAIFISYFYGVESCSVKPSLTTPTPPPPPTTKTPKKFQKKFYKKVTTTPAPKNVEATTLENDVESRFTKYSKYAKNGFFIEIEETVDNKTRVFQMKKIPPIYSRTSATTKRDVQQNNASIPDSSNVEQVYGSDSKNNNGGGGETDKGPSLAEEDMAVQKDWEGDCVSSHWKYCNSLKHITVMNVYNKTEGRGYVTHHMEMDCLVETIACLKNGWTVNRCQLICMSKCNKALLQGYDSVVSHSGPCKYI